MNTDRNRSQSIALGIGILLLFLLSAFGSYTAWIHDADHRDFYPRWAGARRVLEGEWDLYSVEATRAMQIRLYGAEIPPERDQQGFAYPATVLPFLLPFGLIENVEIATAIWDGLTVVLVVISLTLLQKVDDGRASPIPIVLLLLWSYTLLMIFQGQITGLVLAALSVGYWAYQRNHDLVSGLALSVGFVKPELVLLPIVILTLKAGWQRRYRLLVGLLAGFSLTFAFSLILVGWWVPDWVAAIIRYIEYAQTVWPVGFVWDYSPALTLLLGALTVFGVYRVRGNPEGIYAVSIPVQSLIFPQTLFWGLSVLCLPLTLAWVRRARAGVIGAWLLGWVAMLALSNSQWWPLQIVILSLFVILVLSFSHMSQEDPGTPHTT